MFNGDGPLDDDALQIYAFFFTSQPGSPNISYTAAMATPNLTMGNITGTVPIQVGSPQVQK